MDDKKIKNEDTDISSDLKEACRAWGPMEAELVKNFLESHDITCLVRGRTVPFVYPFTVDGLAEFKVFVEEKDLEKAKELLASMPAAEEEGGDKEPQ